MLERFSLLYPDGYNKEDGLTNYTFLDELNIRSLAAPLTRKANPWETAVKDISDYFTVNTEVINYRLNIIEDLIDNPAIFNVLETILPKLTDIIELKRNKDNATDVTASLYSVSELDMYINCVDMIHEGIKKSQHISSPGLRRFCETVEAVYTSEDYTRLKTESANVIDKITNIQSITIGVNLDAQLHPIEAGILSVNDERFRSGNILDRILRFDVKNDGYRCMTPLAPYGKSDQNAFTYAQAVNKAIDTIFKSTVRSWSPVIRRFVVHNTDFLTGLVDDIRFLIGAVNLIKKLEKQGLQMCKPQVCEMAEKVFCTEGLYNPYVAQILNETSETRVYIQPNDFQFDENGMIYIFTGPNQGGKSVHTYAVGITQALFQLGLFVPAQSARLSPVDNIFTNFPGKEEDNINKGRLGEECLRLQKMLEAVTQYSLVLMDETLSSTSAIEATYIASEVITGLSLIGCRCIFATHLHDLSQKVDELNRNAPNGVRIDNLVAGIKEESDSERSFKVMRTKPDGLSYARNIAEKYGITLANIRRRVVV